MNHALIIFGIQATLRAAQAGADLYREHARDRKIFLPNLDLPEGSQSDQLFLFLKENRKLIGTTKAFSDIWNDQHQLIATDDKKLIDEAYAQMLQLKAAIELKKEGKDEEDIKTESQMLAGGRMVEQWREERKPPSAFVRMALTLTDIGLEFVASDPSIFGVGNRGEKLIVAFANNMKGLIPDNVAEFGPENTFADRVLGIFLRAGLSSLSSNASIIFSDDDVAKLFKGVTKPIVETLPGSIHKQIDYRKMVDALAGPSAEAAFKILAENTESYFGKDFSKDKALGAATKALFEEISEVSGEDSIVNVFSEQGVIRIYQAGLGVAVERPSLFIGEDDSAKKLLYKDLLRGTAETLRKYPRFEGPVGSSLVAMAVKVIGHNAPSLLKLNPEEPWEKVAITAISQVTAGLSEVLENPGPDGLPRGALKAFSDEQLLELGRVVLAQVAKTPGMLGVDKVELQNVISGVAEVMAKDDNLLLSADEWLAIAGVAATKAAANPGRLFGISTDDQANAIAVTVIGSVLKVAGNAWTTGGRSDNPLLFGETLKTALTAVIDAMGGNISGLHNQPDIVDKFFKDLLLRASQKPEKFGSDSIVKVIQALISSVLANGSLPTNEEIDNILSSKGV
jgi:hypothetical protein